MIFFLRFKYSVVVQSKNTRVCFFPHAWAELDGFINVRSVYFTYLPGYKFRHGLYWKFFRNCGFWRFIRDDVRGRQEKEGCLRTQGWGTTMIQFLLLSFLLFFSYWPTHHWYHYFFESTLERVSENKLARYSNCVLFTEITVLGSKKVRKIGCRSFFPPLVKTKKV